jgi:hypothetical protein
MNHMTICNLRTEYEELAKAFSRSCGNGSSINTLEWFVNNGYKSNRLRFGYERAMEIAKLLIAEHKNVRRDQTESSDSTKNY